jgi:hypothetical protein
VSSTNRAKNSNRLARAIQKRGVRHSAAAQVTPQKTDYPGLPLPGQASAVSIGDGVHWKNVDPLTLLQAACLWAGIEPLDSYENLQCSPEATARYQMLMRAIEDGRLNAHYQNPAPRTIKLAAQGRHAPDMLVSRKDLEELATLIRDRPLFLFPNSEKARQGQPPTRSHSKAKLTDWYRQRVMNWPASEVPPSRDADWHAARTDGFPTVPRDAIRDLRKRFAPPAWSKKGARPRPK